MKRPVLVLATAALVVGIGGGYWWRGATSTPQAPLFAAADTVAGAALYQANCAACHGANLEGAEDWQTPGADGRLPPPPHDESGHTWHHGDMLLFNYTELGGAEALARQGVAYDSGMPGFADTLTDAQIVDILAFIKSTWPERERQAQAARSEAERNP
ncbi:MAG: cytochrome C [Alphaproteobacteria bacterium HGW-Alphaproteobacteria-4]|jgi:mono/diheme cytochrome c family protein|nr:MAG: cytochrome C [Alphaproteobacteria bacterium HGW-Alphaproteobacteria-4]